MMLSAVGKPCNGVALARPRRVLDEIVMAGASFLHVGNKVLDGATLVPTGEDEFFALFVLELAGLLVIYLFRLLVYVDVIAHKVDYGVAAQNVFPQIVCAVVLALNSYIRKTLIVWQEVSIGTFELCGHKHLLSAYGKMHKATLEFEQFLPFGIAVFDKLLDCVVVRLAGQLVFQFKGDDGETVEEDNHVNRQ